MFWRSALPERGPRLIWRWKPHPDAVTEPEPQPAPITQPGDHEEWTFPQFEEAAGSQPGVAVEKDRGAASSSGESSSRQPSPAQQKESAASEMPASSPKLSLIQPIDGEVFTQYSNGELVKSETLGDWRTHNGIDIAADEGTPVKAAAKGSVTGVRSDALWGYVVEITHPDGPSPPIAALPNSRRSRRATMWRWDR